MARYRYNPATDEVEEVGRVAIEKPQGWQKPMHCEALAVHPDEVAQAKDFDRQLGLGDTEYDAEGSPVFRDSGEYHKFLKAHGYYNRTSGKGHKSLDPSLLKRLIERFQSPDKDCKTIALD